MSVYMDAACVHGLWYTSKNFKHYSYRRTVSMCPACGSDIRVQIMACIYFGAEIEFSCKILDMIGHIFWRHLRVSLN